MGENMSEREFRANEKYFVDASVVQDKHVCLVDDSLVRAITAKLLAQKLRKYKPKSITFLVASPPIRHANLYGIDIQDDGTIAAKDGSIEELKSRLGYDGLHYLDLDNARKAIADHLPLDREKVLHDNTFFDTCTFTGEYWHREQMSPFLAVEAAEPPLCLSSTSNLVD